MDGVTATISETRTIGTFATVRDFDLLNAGEFYRVKFTPSRALVGAEQVFITTTLRTQNDGAFVRLANQEIEEDNAAMGQTFSYLKAFDEETGVSVNIRPTSQGDLRVGFQAVDDPNNSVVGEVLAAYAGTPFIDEVLYKATYGLAYVGSATPAAPADTWLGDWTDIEDFAAFGLNAIATRLGQGYAIWSTDGGATICRIEATAFAGGGAFTDPPQGATHYRIAFQNRDTTGTNTFTLNSILRYGPQNLFMFPASAPIDGTFPAALVKGINTGQQSGLHQERSAGDLDRQSRSVGILFDGLDSHGWLRHNRPPHQIQPCLLVRRRPH